MKRTNLILVGGFLGAGKTTLLASAAKALRDRGLKVAVVTNDQAADLVDTSLLRHAGLDAGEVAGGCFCCRFDQFIETALSLVAKVDPNVVIGEPVGSCTDLSATVLQPIKGMHGDRLHLAPYGVLVDPDRMRELIDPEKRRPMHDSARYILRKQLDEADRIIVNKSDTLTPEERADLAAGAAKLFPGKPITFLSALTGEGVGEWVDAMLSGEGTGQTIVDVDYDVYAEGEAVLGWFNASAKLTAKGVLDWSAVASDVMERVRAEMNKRNAAIAHVKLSLTAGDGQIVANVVSDSGPAAVRGQIDAGEYVAKLVINARAEISPEEMQSVVSDTLKGLSPRVDVAIESIHSLSPGRPTPTHRYLKVVG
jgi:Ni2+-binding GTPase involved in maturation of urease and hydrogenase